MKTPKPFTTNKELTNHPLLTRHERNRREAAKIVTRIERNLLLRKLITQPRKHLTTQPGGTKC